MSVLSIGFIKQNVNAFCLRVELFDQSCLCSLYTAPAEKSGNFFRKLFRHEKLWSRSGPKPGRTAFAIRNFYLFQGESVSFGPCRLESRFFQALTRKSQSLSIRCSIDL